MKHAGASSLAQIDELLAQLRTLGGLTERKMGTFYLRSSAFLHFHEDPAGLFADAKLDGKVFTRFPVTSRSQQSRLVTLVAEHLARSRIRHDDA